MARAICIVLLPAVDTRMIPAAKTSTVHCTRRAIQEIEQ
jgi:hypothetical protein